MPNPLLLVLNIWLCLLVTQTAFAHSGENHDDGTEESKASPQILAPGYQALDYEAPIPGQYRLPILGDAGDGQVLDANGNTRTLSQLFNDQAVIFALVYHNCADVNGCPLTELVLRQIQDRFQNQNEFKDRLSIVSVSFDPARDTPAAIKALQTPEE